jgi:hypothetical protein
MTLFSASASFATDYLFHVGCSSRAFVAEWRTGTIDPGREYLRVATGTKNSECTISDYDPQRDAGLPREIYEGAGGVVQGVPLLGPLVCGMIGC